MFWAEQNGLMVSVLVLNLIVAAGGEAMML